MKICTSILAPFILAVLAIPAQASTSAWTETPGGRVRVVIEGGDPAITGKQEVRGALQIELRPGWKTYWRNPGDAGVPPQISIEGDAKAQIAFPAPVRFAGDEEGGIGYKKPVSLPVTFHIEPGGKRLKGHAFLGMCENICVPVLTEFDFPLDADRQKSSSENLAARTVVETAFAQLPAPASPDFGVSAVKHDKDEAIFDVALPDPNAPAELFVASDTVNLSAPVSVEDGKASQRFIAKMQGKTKDAVIDYTIVQNGKAVSGRLELD
ncbi:protein-disulfide reductase DsbD domain-containing protein [Brucella abortus]|uniref:protein-disulfide reductase DsbD domain-containing protein n=1 Tax=Brucella abortus TaxID=235 RepID=UPI00403F7DDC